MGVWLLLQACSPTVDLDLAVGFVLLGSQEVQKVVTIVVQNLEKSPNFVAAVVAAVEIVRRWITSGLSTQSLFLNVEGCNKCTSCLGKEQNVLKAVWVAILLWLDMGRLFGPLLSL
jgi:hypothetical protein